jgi:DNA repair exonuclease SbcCD ATPase subunit
MLYLSNHGKVWLEQEKHFSEIYLYLYDNFKKAFPEYDKTLEDAPENLEEIPEHLMENMEEEGELQEFKKEIEKEEEKLEETDKQKRVEEINKDFENPIADGFDDNDVSYFGWLLVNFWIYS